MIGDTRSVIQSSDLAGSQWERDLPSGQGRVVIAAKLASSFSGSKLVSEGERSIRLVDDSLGTVDEVVATVGGPIEAKGAEGVDRTATAAALQNHGVSFRCPIATSVTRSGAHSLEKRYPNCSQPELWYRSAGVATAKTVTATAQKYRLVRRGQTAHR